ncbi:hypothetical protein K2Z84_21435 [Candidatus Binatia bacterium]|nr:hypothetical protein [Candidatus Binatia bacterium]
MSPRTAYAHRRQALGLCRECAAPMSRCGMCERCYQRSLERERERRRETKPLRPDGRLRHNRIAAEIRLVDGDGGHQNGDELVATEV